MILYQSKSQTVAPCMWDAGTIHDMAETMQDMFANDEATTPENLMLRGYSREDIFLYGLDAAHIARQRAVKVVM